MVINGYAVNILYVFIPLIKNDLSEIYLPKIKIYKYSLIYFLSIGIFGFLYYVFWGSFSSLLPFRQLISFFLFISIFILSLFPKLALSRENFLKSIFAASLINLFFTLYKIYTSNINLFILSAANSNSFKGLFAQHNTGFLFAFALLASLTEKRIIKNPIIRIFIICISFLGLVLTFARSAFLSFIFGAITFSFLKFLEVVKNKKIYLNFLKQNYTLKTLRIIVEILVLSTLFIFIIRFQDIILNNLSNIFLVFEKLSPSELTRFERWQFAFDFVLNKSLTGTNYLGVWVLSDTYGSIHSSFFDILLRTGFIGLFLYLLMLVDLIAFFYKKNDFTILSGIFCFIGYGLTYEVMLWPAGLCFMSYLIFLRCSQNNYIK